MMCTKKDSRGGWGNSISPLPLQLLETSLMWTHQTRHYLRKSITQCDHSGARIFPAGPTVEIRCLLSSDLSKTAEKICPYIDHSQSTLPVFSPKIEVHLIKAPSVLLYLYMLFRMFSLVLSRTLFVLNSICMRACTYRGVSSQKTVSFCANVFYPNLNKNRKEISANLLPGDS